EDPTDIFIDVIDFGNSSELSNSLRSACGNLLKEKIEPLGDPQAVGELCYLAARIGAEEAISPLTTLAQQEAAAHILFGGEELRFRALRSLAGLLALRPTKADDQHRKLFKKCLHEPAYQMIALTAILGLWPNSQHDLTSKIR